MTAQSSPASSIAARCACSSGASGVRRAGGIAEAAPTDDDVRRADEPGVVPG